MALAVTPGCECHLSAKAFRLARFWFKLDLSRPTDWKPRTLAVSTERQRILGRQPFVWFCNFRPVLGLRSPAGHTTCLPPSVFQASAGAAVTGLAIPAGHTTSLPLPYVCIYL